jgi:hypothetical protein
MTQTHNLQLQELYCWPRLSHPNRQGRHTMLRRHTVGLILLQVKWFEVPLSLRPICQLPRRFLLLLGNHYHMLQKNLRLRPHLLRQAQHE